MAKEKRKGQKAQVYCVCYPTVRHTWLSQSCPKKQKATPKQTLDSGTSLFLFLISSWSIFLGTKQGIIV